MYVDMQEYVHVHSMLHVTFVTYIFLRESVKAVTREGAGFMT